MGDIVAGTVKKVEKYIKNKMREKRRGEVVEDSFSLSDLRLQTRSYEEPIPIVFGEALLSGNIIWISEIRSKVITVKGRNALTAFVGIDDLLNQVGLGNQSSKETRYIVDIAIAICEGVVDELIAVFIEGEIVELSDFNFRFYAGEEEQPTDSCIKEDISFNGICYAVFENFDITPYGKRIPTIEFFIYRGVKPKVNNLSYRLRQMIKGVNIIPGSGEFVYETLQNATYYNAFINDSGAVDGEVKFSNVNTNKKKADALVGLDLMERDLPNLEWASLVVTWFASSTDIANCVIYPAVESGDRKTGSAPVHWNVAGKTRWQVRQVSKREDGSLNYGGTVCDASVIRLLQELKARGKKVMLYPMIFVETIEKPWRGRITGRPSFVKSFFTKQEGYNNFILHYARLARDLCDVFVIGSEMIGITCMKEGVEEFVNLASAVKKIMPSSTKITYAADWSEYHSRNGFYNMDALWASKDIDFIGIDAYFPLTDTALKPSMEEIKKGWENGEGYDYYYGVPPLPLGEGRGEGLSPGKKEDIGVLYDSEGGGGGKPVKIEYESPAFAWKNLRWFVSNYHINADGTQSPFIPFSKKIWFTEFGFPSVHLCSNQPNVFYDPFSSESYFPRYSNGTPDFISQKQALVATLEFIEENKDIIENAFVWCYDIRPFPYFPNNRKIWNDGGLWQYGHWLNGKLNSNSFDEIVLELCLKCGILEEELEFENCGDIVEGFVINKDLPAMHYIKALCDIYFIKMVPSERGLKFTSILQVGEGKTSLYKNALLGKNKITSKVAQEDVFMFHPPSSVSFFFVDKTNRYEAGNVKFETASYVKNNLRVNIPVLFSRVRALEVAKNIIKLKTSEARIKNITLPLEYHFLKPSSILETEGEKFFIEEVKFDENFNINISAFCLPYFRTSFSFDESTDILEENFFESPPFLSCFTAPPLAVNEITEAGGLYIFTSSASLKHKLYITFFGQTVLLEAAPKEQVKGKVIYGELCGGMKPAISDVASYIEVYIMNFHKFKQDIFEGLNMAVIGGEVCCFTKAVYKGEGVFALSYFYRNRCEFSIEGFEKDDFLLINKQVNTFNLRVESGIVGLLKNEVMERESFFRMKEECILKIKILYSSFRILKAGILFYWIFGVNSDLTSFENTDYKLQKVAVKITLQEGVIKSFETMGESLFVDITDFVTFEVNIV